jgi:hypothetical protein
LSALAILLASVVDLVGVIVGSRSTYIEELAKLLIALTQFGNAIAHIAMIAAIDCVELELVDLFQNHCTKWLLFLFKLL